MAPPTLTGLLAAGNAANPKATACFTSDDEPNTITSNLFSAFGANLQVGTSVDMYGPCINELAGQITTMIAQNSITDGGDDNPVAVYVTTAGVSYSLAMVLAELKPGGRVEFNLPSGLAIAGALNSTEQGRSYPLLKSDVRLLGKQYAQINFAQNSYGSIAITPADSDATNGTVGQTKYSTVQFSAKTLPVTGIWLAMGTSAGGAGAAVGGTKYSNPGY